MKLNRTGAQHLLRRIALVAALVSCGSGLAAHESDFADRLFVQEGLHDRGLIFNATNLLLGIESYQGGLGFKMRRDMLAIRGVLDMAVSSTSSTWAVYPGVVLEVHSIDGPVSPYAGGGFDLGIFAERDETTADTWEQVMTYVIETYAVVGIELFLFDFLSVFAEYSIGAEVVHAQTTTSTAGTITNNQTTDVGSSIDVGNDARIGIVLYYGRRMNRAHK